jgi:hypothetical protein
MVASWVCTGTWKSSRSALRRSSERGVFPSRCQNFFQPSCGRQNADNRVHSHPQTTVLPGCAVPPDLARTRRNGLGKYPGRMHEARYVSDDKKNVVRTRWTPMRVKAVRGLMPRAHPSLQSSSTTNRP